jgi:hypothetical protein
VKRSQTDCLSLSEREGKKEGTRLAFVVPSTDYRFDEIDQATDTHPTMAAPLRILCILIIMLSARAFTVGRSRIVNRSFARFLSSEAPDTSIVDICSDKIKTALGSSDVKVTGKEK